SQSTRDDLIARGIAAGNVAVAECGVDHSVYQPDPASKRFDQPTVIYLGRLKKYKSVQHLVAAMPLLRRQVPNARLVIVGSGDYQSLLQKHAQELNLGNAVEFTGYVTLEQKLEYL